MLARSIRSIINHYKDDNHYHANTPESQIDDNAPPFHDQFYFRNYFYRLVGISSDQSLISKFHKFLISFYFRSHMLYWQQCKGSCRFCSKSWNDPFFHIIYRCKDPRIKVIREGIHDSNSEFYYAPSNIHNKVYTYRKIRIILKHIYLKYKNIFYT